MSLPVLIEAGDLIVNPRYVISIKRYYAESISGRPEDRVMRVRVVLRHGTVEDVGGDDARRLLEGVRPMVVPASMPGGATVEGHAVALANSHRNPAAGGDVGRLADHAVGRE